MTEENKLIEQGWQECTTKEREILKRQCDENADSLYKAFEHEKMGTVYFYCEQEILAFLKQLELHGKE